MDGVAALTACFLSLITTLIVGAMPLELGSILPFILVFEGFLNDIVQVSGEDNSYPLIFLLQ